MTGLSQISLGNYAVFRPTHPNFNSKKPVKLRAWLMGGVS
jgi:hypothetical protein